MSWQLFTFPLFTKKSNNLFGFFVKRGKAGIPSKQCFLQIAGASSGWLPFLCQLGQSFFNFLIWRDMKKNPNQPPPPSPEVVALTAALKANTEQQKASTEQQILLTNEVSTILFVYSLPAAIRLTSLGLLGLYASLRQTPWFVPRCDLSPRVASFASNGIGCWIEIVASNGLKLLSKL